MLLQRKFLISLSTAAKLISNLIRYSDNVNCLGKISGNENADGDSQKALDVLADKMITDALSSNEKGLRSIAPRNKIYQLI